MIVLEKKTRKRPEEVLKKAKLFFGTEGKGLEISSEDSCCISFTGGGGFASISVSEDAAYTVVKVEAREWEYQAKEFLSTL